MSDQLPNKGDKKMNAYRTLKMRRLMVQMPPSVHEQVKREAAQLRLSVAELIRIALGRLSLDELRGEAAASVLGMGDDR